MVDIIFGLTIVAFGIVYLIKAILYKNKVFMINKSDNITIENQEGFLKLQFFFSIVSSIYLIIFGFINTMIRLRISYFVLGILLLYYINSKLKLVSKNKGYISFD